MSGQKMKADIAEEFENLREAIQMHLKPDCSITETKAFLQTHIPKEVVCKSEILLDTLLNYLMSDARKKIEGADVKMQSDFLDADFRERIQEWAKQMENKLTLEPDSVNYAADPRKVQGLIASGITFVLGAGVTVAVVPNVVGAIVAGITSIILTALAFKISFNKATSKARKIVGNDIDQYLEESKKQVLEWLLKVETCFDADFRGFCSENGFELEGK